MSFWKDKKVIITGGAGLIGSALAIDLVKNNSSVIILDDLSRGKKEFFKEVESNITFIKMDLRDYDFVYLTLRMLT